MADEKETPQITADALKGGFKADSHKARLDLLPETALRLLIDDALEQSEPSVALDLLITESMIYWYNELDRDATCSQLKTIIRLAGIILRDDEGGTQLDVLLKLGELYALGASKYAARNWELGMDFGRLWSAMMRHVLKFIIVGKYDEVDGQHHMTSVMWCAVALLYFEEHRDYYREFDTRAVITRAEEKGQA